jgi:hypothetical protein
MGKDPFQILGPFEVIGEKVASKEYQKAFWTECDEEFAQLSEANGLYRFSLSIGSNYDPQYVGITKRQFCKEVFNPSNVVKILNDFVPKKGRLCLHLLAKSKDDPNVGFYRSSKRSLLWTEMFLLMLCRKKNPEILNIVGHAFLEDCAIEGLTYPSKGKGKTIKTFRNALGFDSFTATGGDPKKTSAQPIIRPPIAPTAPPIPQPTTQVAPSPQTGK